MSAKRWKSDAAERMILTEGRRATSEEQFLAATPRLQALLGTSWDSFGKTLTFDTPIALFQFLQERPLRWSNWAFRGHIDESWKLAPSLERLSRDYGEIRNDAEEYALASFKRRAHHYLQDVPASDDDLEWLALMRHHGAPTRLLDWTRSPYVAAFFATAEAKNDRTSVIWAIDIEVIRRAAMEILIEAGRINGSEEPAFSFSHREEFNTLILRGAPRPAVVVPVDPFKSGLRVTSQQGLFLCANSPNPGLFEIGLKQVLQSDRDQFTQSPPVSPNGSESALSPRRFYRGVPPDRLYKLLIKPEARRGILRELHRMNINYATLFPGLDGFARSLGTTVTLSEFSPLDFDPEIDSPI